MFSNHGLLSKDWVTEGLQGGRYPELLANTDIPELISSFNSKYCTTSVKSLRFCNLEIINVEY